MELYYATLSSCLTSRVECSTPLSGSAADVLPQIVNKATDDLLPNSDINSGLNSETCTTEIPTMSANSLSIEDLDRDQLEFRCKQLEIENSCSDWLCGEYQKLLDQVIGGHRIGRASEGREREQIIASSSRSIPNVPDRRRRQL